MKFRRRTVGPHVETYEAQTLDEAVEILWSRCAAAGRRQRQVRASRSLQQELATARVNVKTKPITLAGMVVPPRRISPFKSQPKPEPWTREQVRATYATGNYKRMDLRLLAHLPGKVIAEWTADVVPKISF